MVTVKIERRVDITTMLEARCSQVLYCCAITKTLVAVGSAASSTTEYTQKSGMPGIQLTARYTSSGCSSSFSGNR